MTALKYKVIKSKDQYDEYSDTLEELVSAGAKAQRLRDEIDLLTVLIEKWDNDHRSQAHHSFGDPVTLVRSLMDQRKMRPRDLVKILGVSKGLVSDILNYKKGLSKHNIRLLADYFKVDIVLRYTLFNAELNGEFN